MGYDLNFNPNLTYGGGYGSASAPGSSIWDYLLAQKPSPQETLASSIPLLGLPRKQAAYYQPFNNTVAAMQDPNSAQFQGTYNAQKQLGQSNLAESIAEMVRQNRKQTKLGRTPLFAPERGGETLFRGVNQGYQDIQNKALGQTYDVLGNTAKMQQLQAQQMSATAASKAGQKSNIYGALAHPGAASSITGMLKGLFGL